MPRPIAPVMRAMAERSLCCFLMSETIPQREAGLRFDGDRMVGVKEPEHHLATYSRLRRLDIRILKDAGFPVVLVRPRPGALWHPVGTARIGDDLASSADWGAGSTGMENLYVVDLSRCPPPERSTRR